MRCRHLSRNRTQTLAFILVGVSLTSGVLAFGLPNGAITVTAKRFLAPDASQTDPLAEYEKKVKALGQLVKKHRPAGAKAKEAIVALQLAVKEPSYPAFALAAERAKRGSEQFDALYAATKKRAEDAAETETDGELHAAISAALTAKNGLAANTSEAKKTLDQTLSGLETEVKGLSSLSQVSLPTAIKAAAAKIDASVTAAGEVDLNHGFELFANPENVPDPDVAAKRVKLRAAIDALASFSQAYASLAPSEAVPNKPWTGLKAEQGFDPNVIRTKMSERITPHLAVGGFLEKRLDSLLETEKLISTAMTAKATAAVLASDGSNPLFSAADSQAIRETRAILAAVDRILATPAAARSKWDISIGPAIKTKGQELTRAIESRSVITSLSDPTLGSDASKWVSDYIRLFYFTDVKRLLLTLNPNTRLANPNDASYAEEADRAARDLGAVEDRVTVLFSSANQLAEQLGGLEDQLSQAKRTADAKARVLEKAQNEKERFDTLDADADARIAEIDGDATTSVLGELGTQKNELAAANQAIKTLEADPDRSGEEDKELKLQRRKKSAAERRIAALENEKKSLQAAKKKRSARKAVANRAFSDAEAESEKAQNALTTAEDETNGIKGEITRVQTELVTQRRELTEKRLTARRSALDEARAFAKARDNTPFFVAPPGGNDSDPIRRVVIYGYGDSNTLVIRGNPNDVEAAKELIAQYDRPAPQARITLYTLQINGTTKKKQSWFKRSDLRNPIDEAISGVKDELRDLRTAIGVVQETLRESIIQEVGRCAEISQFATQESGQSGFAKEPRLARNFFFAPEVRKSLGFTFDDKNLSQNMARGYCADDLRAIADCLEKIAQPDLTAEAQTYYYFVARHAYQRLVYTRGRHNGVEGLTKNSVELTALLNDLATFIPNDTQKLERGDKMKSKLDSKREFSQIFIVFRNRYGRFLVEKRCNQREFIDRLIEAAKTMRQSREHVCLKEEDVREWEYLTRWTMPDPARVTTLGEMMFVLSLSSKMSRERVLNAFEDRLFTALHISASAPPGKNRTKGIGQAQWVWRERLLAAYSGDRSSLYPQFLNTLLNGFETTMRTDPTTSEVSSNGLEVLQAVETKARETVAAEIHATIRAIGQLPNPGQNGTGLQDELRKRYRPLAGWLGQRLNGDLSKLEQASNQKIGPFEHLWKTTFAQNINVIGQDARAWELSRLAARRNSISLARPRVAAADDMIKRMIIATENDLDQFFVAPSLEEIRKRIRDEGVELGMLEQQSILATNRMVARLGTNANTSATLDGATDFRDEASQLATMIQQAKGDSISPGLATAGLGFAAAKIGERGSINAGGTAALVGLLDIFSSQNAEPRGEVFSINSNGVFKVSPIFDPSGQALQFKFDHVAQSIVQGPDGSSTRELPRIERTTVQNTVQLTNLEFREVASYGLNAKIGTPDTRRGGIPILRDLPVIRDIPILGYYSRRNASAATRQESFIFAQTSMYPTVGDIVSLMLDVNVPPNLDPSEPDYLRAWKKLQGAEK